MSGGMPGVQQARGERCKLYMGTSGVTISTMKEGERMSMRWAAANSRFKRVASRAKVSGSQSCKLYLWEGKDGRL